MNKEKKIAIYIRVSTEHQNLDLQRNELLQYCQIRQWNKIEIYSDFGLSGSRSNNRPEFQRLMKDARQRKFNTVLVYKLDRLGRSLIDLVNYLQELSDLKIEFIALRDGIDLSTSLKVTIKEGLRPASETFSGYAASLKA